MEMWLKQSILVFLAAGVAAKVVSKEIYLDETQKREEVVAGSPLILHCNVTTGTSDRSRVLWYFDPSGPSFNETYKMLEVVINGPANNSAGQLKSKSKMECHRKTCRLSQVSETDSGWYFCKVTNEIPNLHHYKSNGTEVHVTSQSLEESTARPSLMANTSVRPDNGVNNDLWMWILLAVSSFILIVLLAIFILHKGRCSRSGGSEVQDPIYANAPRPRKTVSNLKIASSSQHLPPPSPSRSYDEFRNRYEC